MEIRRHILGDVNISQREWRFVGVMAMLSLIITTAPYVFATLTVPSDQQFMGLLLHVSDHSQYSSWYREFQTQFIISNKLTPEPNPPLFFNLLWWVLGRIGLYTGLRYGTVFQAFRWLATAFFLVMLYAFVSRIFSNPQHRRVSFLLVCLGSGFGWIWVLFKYTVTQGKLLFPLDVYISEGNSFLSIMACPVLIESAGFILWVFLLLLKADQKQQLRYAVYAGVVAFLLGWQHTYDLWIVWSIPSVYIAVRFLIERKLPLFWIKGMLIVGAISWMPALYSVLLTSLNPIWNEILAQFANAGVYSPTVPHMFIFMGISLVLAIVALVLRMREQFGADKPVESMINYESFVITWFFAGWALVYIPTDYQVHLINSWQVPVGILATVALFKYIFPAFKGKYSSRQMQTALMVVVIGLVMMTNVYLWLWRFVDLARHNYPYYLYNDEIAAMAWLEANAEPNDVVLSSYDVGHYVPALTGTHAFLAHWAQTVDFYGKRNMVEEFFAKSTDDARRQQILQQYNVDYIFYGPAEQALGSYRPETSPFLQRVYSLPRVEIYQVQREQW